MWFLGRLMNEGPRLREFDRVRTLLPERFASLAPGFLRGIRSVARHPTELRSSS